MKDYVITIEREFSSGGRKIGMMLSKLLDIKCYDGELLKLAAKESGFCEEIFQNQDEKPTNSFLYSLVMDTYSFSNYGSAAFMDMPLNHKVFLAQFDTIRKLAASESCIIVGRCADYALSENPNCVKIFIQASDIEKRLHYATTELGVPEAKGKDILHKKDKQRATYYNYFSDNKWGDARCYDLCLDSSKIGFDGCAKMILQYLVVRGIMTEEELEGILKKTPVE